MIHLAHLWAVSVGAFLTLLCNRLEETFGRSYWSVSELLVEPEVQPPRAGAMARRFGYPLIVGVVAAAAVDASWAVGAASGGLAAFLIVWPVLYRPALLPEGSTGKETVLYLLYFFFFAAYIVAGGVGGALGGVTRRLVGAGTRAIDADLLRDVGVDLLGTALVYVLALAWRWTRREYQLRVESKQDVRVFGKDEE